MTVSRLEKVRAAMAEAQLDALLVGRPENRAYLSGFTGSAGLLLITQQDAYLITDFRYVEQASVEAPAFKVCRSDTTPAELVGKLCQDAGVRRLGFEGDFVTVDDFQTYRKALPDQELLSATGLVEKLRMIKDAEEQALMRRAAAITDEAFRHILGFIRPGVTERDVAMELEFTIRRLGAQGLAFETIVASGPRSSLPHGQPTDRVIEEGDLVTLDFGARYQDYCSDMTRTVMVGEPSAKQREIYEIVLEAQQRGVAACRPGITGKELDEVCRSYIREKGYGGHFGHGTGHGVGRFIHEGPRVSTRGEQDVLQPGMVVTIEPGIYLPGWGGVRIEDMVLVTETGCEVLSRSPKELIIL